MTDVLNKLREQLEEIRQTRGLSIFRIALDSGVSESAIKRLLNGAHSQEYTIERLLKYVEKQRKPVDYDVALLLAQNQKLLAQNKQLQTENKALREKLIERILVEYLDQMNGLIEKIGELVICDKVEEEQPFKIISVFRPSDRLDELDKIPEMPNGGINYWEASQLLCEKDGGRLPTMKELAQFASYIYGEHIPPYANVDNLKVKQMREELQKFEMPFYVWSSEEFSSNYAYSRYFSSGSTGYNDYGRYGSRPLAVCLGD